MFRLPTALLVIAVSSTLHAQSSNDKIDDLVKRIEKDIAESPQTWPIGWPGSSALTPTAFGGIRGMVGFGLGYQPRMRFDHGRKDGLFGVVVPVGDPVGGIGFDVVGTLTDIDHLNNRGSFDFVVHKRYRESAIAIGSERLARWGVTDTDRTFYLVGSHYFRLKESRSEPFSRLTVSAGIGNGRFRREADVFSDRKTVNVFGSAAISVVREINAFAEWSGQDLDMGVSVAPFHDIPLVFSVSAVDMTRSAGDGTRVSYGVGYVYRFR